MKGGQSDAGNRTIASHTGSMMGKQEIWNAVFKQTGSLRVSSLHEWVDAVMALSLLPDKVSGNGVFLATGGGGNSIIYGDIFSHEGLDVPELSGKTIRSTETDRGHSGIERRGHDPGGKRNDDAQSIL